MDTSMLDCACVIHGDKYDMQYVDKLYSMLRRHVHRDIRLHVWTEPSRSVPEHYVKHGLTEWPGIKGPRKSWWYKLQMFDPAHGVEGRLLYFDLDIVIVDRIDWIVDLSADKFWAVKDFRYLWRSDRQQINSSVMYWKTADYHWIWADFLARDRTETVKRFAGDQDFLQAVIPGDKVGFFDPGRIKSYRWQVKDGGWNNSQRVYHRPGAGCNIDAGTSIVVFHGDPKPAAVTDAAITQHWC